MAQTLSPGGGDPKLQALANHINSRLAQPSLPMPPPLAPPGQGLTGPVPSLGQALTNPHGFQGSSHQPLASTTSVPAALGAQSTNMEGYFQNESQAIINQQREAGYAGPSSVANGYEGLSKKKILLTGVYVGGAVFLISFIILVSIRPRFVMKKVKKDNGTEEHKCNFLAIFLISLALLIAVLVAAGISVAKAK
jgi:hypothetical protein